MDYASPVPLQNKTHNETLLGSLDALEGRGTGSLQQEGPRPKAYVTCTTYSSYLNQIAVDLLPDPPKQPSTNLQPLSAYFARNLGTSSRGSGSAK